MSTKRPFLEVFPTNRAFLPVIHAEDVSGVLYDLQNALKAQANGVFLIGHHIDFAKLCEIYKRAKREAPEFWIGVNFLDLTVYGAQRFARRHLINSGLWVDDAGLVEREEEPAYEARANAQNRVELGWPGLFFGGVAFKYKKPVKDPGRMAKIAKDYVDVVTTSGDATGLPPKIEKIKDMCLALDGHPLAIASGLTPENVRPYVPLTNAFMSSTGVSVNGRLDVDRMRRMVYAIHSG